MCEMFRRNNFLCFASLLLLALSSDLSEHNLGDSVTSKQSESDLFADIDINGNGRISEAELYEFVQETGGDSLDESKEVHNAVSSVMSVLDGNNDRILKKDDLSKYMKSLASLLPLDEVARWVAHAQQMPPDVVKSFMDNGITGYDFPELLQNNGALLEQELGIARVSLRRRLMRGMRMKLLGMGNHPAAPELLTLTSLPPTPSTTATSSVLLEGKAGGGDDHCEQATALIQWGSGNSHLPDFLDSNDMDFPVHKYQLYRERGPAVGGSDSSDPMVQQRTLAGKDELIYEGMEMFFKDRLPVMPSRADSVTYTYRLVAWNVIGRSEYTVFEHTVPQLSRHCLEVLADVASVPLQLSAPPRVGQGQDWDDNVSQDVALERSDSAVGAGRVLEANRITPSPPDGVSELGIGPAGPAVVVSAMNHLLSVLTTAGSILGFAYYSVKYTVLAISFMLSFVFTVMRVKSLLMYNKAMEREGAAGDRVTDAVLGYVTYLEPACGWLQRNLLAPSLSWVAPLLTRLLDALGSASPACRPMTTHLANAIGLVVKMVLEPGMPGSVDSDSSGQSATASRRDSAGRGTSRHPPGMVLRNQDSVSNMSCSSDDVPNSESMEVSFHQCYLCTTPVTDKLIKNGKRKRHHCSRCGGIFCKKCGTVDHVALQCQVGGKCVCRRCQSSAGAGAGAGRVDARRGSVGVGVGVGKTDIRDLSSLDVFINASISGGKAGQEGGGSKQGSNASSRSNSPVPELARYVDGDSDTSSVCRSTPPVSTPEALRGRPPLHTSTGSAEKATMKKGTFSRISMSILGFRHRSPSPPLEAPVLRHQGSVPRLPSSSSLGSLDAPDMVRSATYPQKHSSHLAY
mmetsp:Transcript_8423/g.14286  ORF Transcript_8423/g.14286 Transcript_8423/m.14286 type:complete len:855 (+) Transcript_8423:187-2751(+)